MYRRPHMAIAKMLSPILVLFLIGMMPWIDNWSHLFGFLYGFLLSFVVMPYISFGHFDKRRKVITILVCLALSCVLFFILVIVFYVAPITECDACLYFNCIPLGEMFCEDQKISLRNDSTYNDFEK